MQLHLSHLALLLPVCIGLNEIAASYATFAYERGKCEPSIFSVVEDMLRSEVRALINPRLRYSSKKILQYDLYTPLNPNVRQILPMGDAAALRKSNFNPKWPVRFSIHGWTGKSLSCSNAAIKDAYLARGEFNVIIVDWSTHASDISYGRISKQLDALAANFVKFVQFLHQQTGVAYERMYLIGHSAGSHIAGLSGKLLKPQQFGAIFALDPAGLNQLNLSEEHRLAPGDAQYVESIHSDVTLLGNPKPTLSRAAFFANWGQGQPHCPNATAAEFDFACDHFAALYYFAESVRDPKMFGALRCNEKSIRLANCTCGPTAATGGVATPTPTPTTCTATEFMGGEPAVPKSGVYYFSTQSRPPFGYSSGEVRVRPPRQSTILESNFLPSSFVKQFRVRL